MTAATRATLLVVLVDDVEFIAIRGFTDKNIGNEFQ